MFNDQTSDAVSFYSQLSPTKVETTVHVQTTGTACSEHTAQTAEVKNATTQSVNSPAKQCNVDYNKLASFLKKVTPGILDALDEAYGTSAFDGYSPDTFEDSVGHPHLLQKICNVAGKNEKVKVSNLSWGISGGTLAVSHSFPYHRTWCNHQSNIILYNAKNDNKFVDVPITKLETSSCVTVLSCHPTEPSIIAAGLFNGDVLVWNLQDDNAVSPVHVCTHDDSISQISWRPRTLNNEACLVSACKHGYILVHKILANFTIVQLFKRFKIIKEHNPTENSRPRSASGRNERELEAGLCITNFDFSHHDPSIFILGTLCGGIYKCSTHRKIPIEGNDNLLDPVIDDYEKHQGSVTCVKCSPNRNIFLTSATDKEIRVYSFDMYTSQYTISVEDTVTGLIWMIGNHNVFAAYGAGTTIKFYDACNDKSPPTIKLDSSSKEGISSISLNFMRDMLAIGDVEGNVEIWNVPKQLF